MGIPEKKVLIVDDEEEFLEALEIRLQQIHFQVMKAVSATQVFQILNNQMPDLIFLDIHLPGLSGLEICDVLKKDARTAKIPIIFLTGSSDKVTELEARHVGGFSYLSKPLDQSLLKKKVEEALLRAE